MAAYEVLEVPEVNKMYKAIRAMALSILMILWVEAQLKVRLEASLITFGMIPFVLVYAFPLNRYILNKSTGKVRKADFLGKCKMAYKWLPTIGVGMIACALFNWMGAYWVAYTGVAFVYEFVFIKMDTPQRAPAWLVALGIFLFLYMLPLT